MTRHCKKTDLLFPAVILLLLSLVSCSTRTVHILQDGATRQGYSGSPPHMNYSIQVGAFSKFSNAVAYTNKISANTEAYCFKDRDGLFKVRIGNFQSRDSARVRAIKLVSAGIIENYFIFNPTSYAASHAKIRGAGYLRESLVQTTRRYLGVNYVWGGTSARKGFDCSGLTMTVYRQNGIRIPRTAAQQFRAGKKISSWRMKKGDLLFFSNKRWNRKNNITHVALYIGDGKLIHAPGRGKKVRRDRLSKAYFKKHLVGIRTYL